jgi:predicted secreted protein
MATIKGYNCTLKLNTAEVLRHRGVELNRTKDILDVTTKNSAGDKEQEGGLRSWETNTITLIRDTGDSMIDTLLSAYENDTTLTAEFAVTGGNTRTGSCTVSDYNTSTPHDDVVKITFKLVGTGALS